MARPVKNGALAPGPRGCLLYVGGSPNGKGYVRATIDGRRDYVHRHAWRQAHGEIPPGAHVLHKCDVRNCVNPEHLFLGDYTANMRDAAAKGRINTTKLTAEKVREIRRRADAGDTRTALAHEFGLSIRNVSKIALRQSWVLVE